MTLSGGWRRSLINNLYNLALWAAVLLGLVVIGQVNYVLFHSLAELFSVVIAFTTALLAFNARPYLRDAFLVTVGIGFGFAAGFNLLHVLAFRGVDLFGDGANVAAQLWLCERFMQALTLCIAPFALRISTKDRRYTFFTVFSFGTLSTLLLLSIFTWRTFPVTFTDSAGLTDSKIGAEILITLLFAASGGVLWRMRARIDGDVLRWLLLAIVLNVVTEFFFMGYVTVDGTVNLLGHLLKILAYAAVYKALIDTGFARPQRLIHAELSERTRQLETLLDTVPAVVWITHDRKAQHILGNRTANEIIKIPAGVNQSVTAPNGDAPTHFRVYHAGKELAPHEMPLQVSAANGTLIQNYEETIVFSDGSELRLLGNVSPLLDAHGQPAGAVGAFMDVTRRMNAEDALAESLLRYRSLFNSLTEGFVVLSGMTDVTGSVTDMMIEELNPSLLTITGMTAEQLLGRSLSEFTFEDSNDWLKHFIQVARQGEPLRFEDSKTLPGKILQVTAFQSGEMRVAALVEDITERRTSRDALQKSEARLRRLIDSNIIGVIYSHEDGSISVANDAFLHMLGYTRDDFEAGRVNWVSLTPEEYLPLDMRAVAEARVTGACTPYEKEYLHANGNHVPVMIGYAYFEDGIATYICFVIDLTERKLAEAGLEEYARQLETSNRELQDFAFVASHDLQEPLRKIQAFGDLLKRQTQDTLTEEERDYLNRMLNASGRMRHMIDGLLSLSRVTTRPQPFEMIDLNVSATEAISDLEMRIQASGASVEVGELPTIEADPLQMRQLVMNLVGNALKFHKDDEAPRVFVTSTPGPGTQSITLQVRDEGIGFEQDYADKIFQPFQRLHGMGRYEGSGIGLAICRKIAERHGGTIRAEGTLNGGATFSVMLPIRQPKRRT